MKRQLVCLAPDGTLELWERRKCREALKWESWSLGWQVTREEILDSLFGIGKRRGYLWDEVWGGNSPRFWGREILGTL